MHNNTTTIEKTDKRVARPLKVLVPLIKKDLEDGQDAAKLAAMEYYVSAGEKLLEAKDQIPHGSWVDWLRRNFHLSRVTAAQYMRAASKCKAGFTFETLSEMRGDNRHLHGPNWTEPVRDVLKNLRAESFNLRAHDLSVKKEGSLERNLALQLIDIGYKVLATRLHPDKGGSPDAMRRLNRVRTRLKEAA